MRIHRFILALALPLVALACSDATLAPTEPPLFAPASGNGGKQVFEWNSDRAVNCGEVSINRNNTGWVQVHQFKGKGNRNIELRVYHVVLTYSNDAGETYVTRDVGPDHFYFDQNGDLIITLTGRSITGSGYIGHVVINLTTGETLLVAGQEGGDLDAMACEALT